MLVPLGKAWTFPFSLQVGVNDRNILGSLTLVGQLVLENENFESSSSLLQNLPVALPVVERLGKYMCLSYFYLIYISYIPTSNPYVMINSGDRKNRFVQLEIANHDLVWKLQPKMVFDAFRWGVDAFQLL